MFKIDIEQYPQCGGTLKIIAAIEDPLVIARSSRISACPVGHRPEHRRGHSILQGAWQGQSLALAFDRFQMA